MVGDSCRHGPHHTAQKSTRTGLSLLTTSWSQFAAVRVTTLALAICVALPGKMTSQPVARTAGRLWGQPTHIPIIHGAAAGGPPQAISTVYPRLTTPSAAP